MSGPDHSSLPLEAIRQRLWRAHLNDRDPQQALEHAYMMAHDEAEDAARDVLELVALPDNIAMEPHVWEYFGEVLGRYDTTIPTGERTGKRWCREFGGKRWVAEYTETSIIWRPVTLDTSFCEPDSQGDAEDQLAGLRSQLEEERVVRAGLLNRVEKADARVAELEANEARLKLLMAAALFAVDMPYTPDEPWVRLIEAAHKHGRKLQHQEDDVRLKELEAWQLAVAEPIGFANRPEGQAGYNVADAETVVVYVRGVERRADRLEDAAAQRDEALTVLRPLAEWGPLAESLDVAEFRVDVANADAVLAKYREGT